MLVPNRFPVEGHPANFTGENLLGQMPPPDVGPQIAFRVMSPLAVWALVFQFHLMSGHVRIQGVLRGAPQSTIITDERLVRYWHVPSVLCIRVEHLRTTGFLAGVHPIFLFLVPLLMCLEVTFVEGGIAALGTLQRFVQLLSSVFGFNRCFYLLENWIVIGAVRHQKIGIVDQFGQFSQCTFFDERYIGFQRQFCHMFRFIVQFFLFNDKPLEGCQIIARKLPQ